MYAYISTFTYSTLVHINSSTFKSVFKLIKCSAHKRKGVEEEEEILMRIPENHHHLNSVLISLFVETEEKRYLFRWL